MGKAIQKFLVVDDSPLARQNIIGLVNEKFENQGYIEAENGKLAVEAYENSVKTHNKSDIDLIILDVNMPEMNGTEALEAIRNIEEKYKVVHPVKIIMVTTEDQKGFIISSFSLGIDAYIIKPYTEEDFKKALFTAYGESYEEYVNFNVS